MSDNREVKSVRFELSEDERELLRLVAEINETTMVDLLRGWTIDAARQYVGEYDVEVEGKATRLIPTASFLVMVVQQAIEKDKNMQEEFIRLTRERIERAIESKSARQLQLA